MKGTISNIQRFSLTDGEGIRSTVFFKGCNLSCTWCHNPETIKRTPELMFYESKCIGCGKCFEVCPEDAHKIISEKHIIDRTKCVNCGKCAGLCYAEALVICGKEMSIEEVLKEVIQDKAYYNSSNGGVTLSGGEVLCQKDFAIKLTDACHREDISVAVETNLCFSFEYAKDLLEKVDFVMCDLKIWNKEKHEEYTGAENPKIIENIKKLDELNIPFTVRTPLIPGATDDCENIKAIAYFLKELKNLKRYEILNYNPLGEGKYKALDMKNDFESARPFGKERLDEIKTVLDETGINYKIV